ncbi:JAB domain-containing protein [Sphingomonas sp. GB1N7]|uniref:JAB domain-containing protein n=1 Tax=Parasphingomonas caseinilytica TaxID=3096158 RepID=UPI002FC9270D
MAPVLTISTVIRHVRDMDAALGLFGTLAALPYEMIAFAYLDPKRMLLGMRHTQAGGVDSAEVPVRLVVADALAFDAAMVVMAHNHPGGDPAPSEADQAATRRLARALRSVEVRLVDHLVLAAGGGASSFRAIGLL